MGTIPQPSIILYHSMCALCTIIKNSFKKKEKKREAGTPSTFPASLQGEKRNHPASIACSIPGHDVTLLGLEPPTLNGPSSFHSLCLRNSNIFYCSCRCASVHNFFLTSAPAAPRLGVRSRGFYKDFTSSFFNRFFTTRGFTIFLQLP